jgi:hypothetical protein
MPCTDCPLRAMSPNSGIEGAGSVPNNVMIIVDMPTMSEIQRFAGQVLSCPEKAIETLSDLAELESKSNAG